MQIGFSSPERVMAGVPSMVRFLLKVMCRISGTRKPDISIDFDAYVYCFSTTLSG
jgi:hypothetical protein